jgi:hypothetical protein
MGVVGAMSTAGHATELEPIVIAYPVAVHGTMNDHSGFALAMRFEDSG